MAGESPNSEKLVKKWPKIAILAIWKSVSGAQCSQENFKKPETRKITDSETWADTVRKI